jgi:flagellar biogenesis protein FliO
VVLLAALSAAALLAARRRMRPGARIVEVVETTHLGPKRALVVARIQGDLLLLASSEAGITVLQSRPGLALTQAPETVAAPHPTPTQASALAGILGKLRRVPAPAGDPPAFDALLHESAEDLELRRKLAHGLGGSVR